MAIEDEKVAATMEDIRNMETSLTSSMDKLMDEMREMIAMKAKDRSLFLFISGEFCSEG